MPSESKSQSATAVVAVEPVMYVNIPQPFLFNVTGDKDRLSTDQSAAYGTGSKNEDLARYHSPLVESTLLATFASTNGRPVRTLSVGRVELRDDKATEILKRSLKTKQWVSLLLKKCYSLTS